MRILLAAETYYPLTAGSAYATYRLANGLAGRGHEVFVVSSGSSFTTTKTREGKVEVYRISSVPILFHKGYRFAPFAYHSTAEIIKEIKPDILHVQDHFFVSWALIEQAKKNNIATVGTNHFHPDNFLYYLKLSPKIEDKLRKLAWKHFQSIFGQLDIVTTPSETARRILKESGSKWDIKVISNGIDLNRFKPRPAEEISKVVAKYHLKGNHKKILFVGRLEKEKNIDVLVRALAIVNEKIPAKLYLSGFGSQEDELKKLAEELKIPDSIVFLGKTPDDDLIKIYSAMDLFATASTVELQGLVVMEAMASGLPIVSSVGMALSELTHDGVNGFIFPNGDHKTAAGRILKVLSDNKLAAQMSEKSLELIQKHDFERSLDAYENIYRQAIAMHHRKMKLTGVLAQKIILNSLAIFLSVIVFIIAVSATSEVYENKAKINYAYQKVKTKLPSVNKAYDKIKSKF